MSCYNFIFLEYYGVYNYGGIEMISSRGKNFLYKSYICGIQKSLNDMFEELNVLTSTCSISADFIKQFLIYQKVAERISKSTSMCTNFRPVFDIASGICEKRNEMLKDIGKIQTFCGNFKNCSVGVQNYKNDFRKICGDYSNILKNVEVSCSMNVFFLNFMIRYNEFSILLNTNALKYRLCPQLRLISEYSVLLSKKENIKMKYILTSMKK